MATVSSSTSNASSALRQLAQQLMRNETRPLAALQSQKSGLEDRRKTYRSLATKLSELRRLNSGLTSTTSSNPLRTIKVAGSDDTKVSVSATASASTGGHTVRVDQVAARHTLASVTLTEDGTTLSDLVGSEIRFQITAGGESKEVVFTPTEGQTDGEVLTQAAQAVVDAGGGAEASVVKSASGEIRLLIQARATGREARVTAIGDLAGGFASRLGIVGVAGENTSLPATVQEGTDASVVLDGLPVSSNSNELSNVLPGVTLTLHTASEETRSFRVDRDASVILTKVEEYLTKFNETLDEVRSLTRASDSSGQTRGPLAGEVTVTRLRSELREVLTGAVDGNPLNSLAEVGIVADREGHLRFQDRASFQDALAENPGAVEGLWNGEGGVARRLDDLLDRYARTGGILSLQQEAIGGRLRSVETRIRTTSEALARRESTLIGRLAQLESSLGVLSRQQEFLGGLLSSSDQLLS